jgi:hypothetical protein
MGMGYPYFGGMGMGMGMGMYPYGMGMGMGMGMGYPYWGGYMPFAYPELQGTFPLAYGKPFGSAYNGPYWTQGYPYLYGPLPVNGKTMVLPGDVTPFPAVFYQADSVDIPAGSHPTPPAEQPESVGQSEGGLEQKKPDATPK